MAHAGYPPVILGLKCSPLSDVTPGEQPASPFTWKNDGRVEHAQQMAGHDSPRTTKLYDRTKDEITLSEVERIRL
jgi:hypothetical protein